MQIANDDMVVRTCRSFLRDGVVVIGIHVYPVTKSVFVTKVFPKMRAMSTAVFTRFRIIIQVSNSYVGLVQMTF